MMGAVQPFLSGAISKTVNLPEDATVDDVMHAYVEGWKLGLKALAVYRDGSKRTQPLNAGRDDAKVRELEAARPVRRKLPDERKASTHKFSIAGHEGYLTVGLYEDGQPGEIFLRMAKEGSTVSGLMDTIATMTSIALQYGVPLKALVDKFSHTRFEPAGFTNNRGHPDREVGDGLRVPLPRPALPARRGRGDGRAGAAGVEDSGLAPRAPRAAVAGGSGARAGAALSHRQPVRRAGLPRLRLDHDPQRHLLQVPELRRDERLQLSGSRCIRRLERGVRGADERGAPSWGSALLSRRSRDSAPPRRLVRSRSDRTEASCKSGAGAPLLPLALRARRARSRALHQHRAAGRRARSRWSRPWSSASRARRS